MSNQVITDLSTLAKAIKDNQAAHAKVDARWQILALSAIHAFQAHGNVFYINAVWKALGKGARHAAMTAYFLAFGGVKANTGANKDETPFIKDKDKQVDLEGAEKTLWHTMAPSKAPDEELDYLSIILKAAKRTPKEGQTVAHTDFRQKVLELAEALQAQVAGADDAQEPPQGDEPAAATPKATKARGGRKVTEPAAM